jgi:hypothetical protein
VLVLSEEDHQADFMKPELESERASGGTGCRAAPSRPLPLRAREARADTFRRWSQSCSATQSRRPCTCSAPRSRTVGLRARARLPDRSSHERLPPPPRTHTGSGIYYNSRNLKLVEQGEPRACCRRSRAQPATSTASGAYDNSDRVYVWAVFETITQPVRKIAVVSG